MAPERGVPRGMMQRCVPSLHPRLKKGGWGKTGGEARPPKLLPSGAGGVRVLL